MRRVRLLRSLALTPLLSTPAFLPTSTRCGGPQPSQDRPPHSERIEVGDVVRLCVVGGSDFDGSYVVRPNGSIDVPLLGEVDVSGRSDVEAVSLLEERCREFVGAAVVELHHQCRFENEACLEEDLQRALEECALLERLLDIRRATDAVTGREREPQRVEAVERCRADLAALRAQNMTDRHPAVIAAVRQLEQAESAARCSADTLAVEQLLETARQRVGRLMRALLQHTSDRASKPSSGD